MRPLLIISSLFGALAVAGCGQPPVGGGEPNSVTVPPHVPAAPSAATSTERPAPSTAEQQGAPESSTASSSTATSVPETTSETPDEPNADEPVGDLACGDVTNKAGASYSLFSRRASDGSYAGCTETINVMSAYLNLPADEYDGTSRSATVQGYRCQVLPSGEAMKTACDNPSKSASIYTTD